MDDLNLELSSLDENSCSSLSNNFKKEESKKTTTSIENEPFYFESDTLALRNDPNYSCLLKTLVLLEAQRVQATNDLETLMEKKEEALKDPLTFIENLENSSLPTRQQVYILPDIDWNKYYDCVELDDLEAIRLQSKQRSKSLRQSNKLLEQEATIDYNSIDRRASSRQASNAIAASSQSRRKQNNTSNDEQDDKKYNQPWSVEEQRLLEELLLEFPPEDNEAARFRKIANKMGTRSQSQVQSHCQKYFIKLAKAGLPIPGRMPNLKTYLTKKGNRGNRKSSLSRGACSAFGFAIGSGSGRARLNDNPSSTHHNRRIIGRGTSLNEISSMWTSFNPPITMNDDDKFKIDEEKEEDDGDDEDESFDEEQYDDSLLESEAQEDNSNNN